MAKAARFGMRVVWHPLRWVAVVLTMAAVGVLMLLWSISWMLKEDGF